MFWYQTLKREKVKPDVYMAFQTNCLAGELFFSLKNSLAFITSGPFNCGYVWGSDLHVGNHCHSTTSQLGFCFVYF